MPALKYWDGAQYVEIPMATPAPDEVSVQAGEPAVHADLWVSTNEFTEGMMDQATADARYVNLSGDAMAGALVLVEPSQPLGGATKRYVDQVVTVSIDSPTAPPIRDGLLWFSVAPPTVPPRTWGDVADEFGTWGAVKASGLTWGQLSRGELPQTQGPRSWDDVAAEFPSWDAVAASGLTWDELGDGTAP